jgi:ubiquinone biosynthesis protein
MANWLTNSLRLARAGVVLATHGARIVPANVPVPLALKFAHAATAPLRWLTAPFRIGRTKDDRLASALTRLGPSYIKLGQFLSTRADLIPAETARDLAHLQDRLPPFSMSEARRAVEDAFGGRLEDHFDAFGPPVAAASIAQVHRATVRDPATGATRDVAVKILRPNVEARFRRDLDSFRFAARLIERVSEKSRRLKPLAVIDNLARTTDLEMDLRLEAAAMSEMADNIKDDIAAGSRFRIPAVDWRRTSRRVLTVAWVDGIPIGRHDALRAAGHDLKALGITVLQSFLRHAMRDGFFHGDMHQGNLLVDAQGHVVAVDFGIVGRLGKPEQRFLAEILYGLITRNYRRAAEVHFTAGYVPPHHSVEVFAQAMRAIGEPIHGRTAEEISMADLLAQLFAYTDVFDMQTRPELILLQKSMVIVEGVARGLDPTLNIWSAAEPIARDWIETNLGVAGQIRNAGDSAGALGRLVADAPRVLAQAERVATTLASAADQGFRLDDETVARIAAAQSHSDRWTRRAVFAASLAVIAICAWLYTGAVG